jgi:hypothetical protein
VSHGISPGRRLATTLTWPLGISLTAWHYLWRILPVYRTDEDGSLEADLPPDLPDGVSREDLLQPDDGNGPLLHRTYEVAFDDTDVTAADLIARVAADPNLIAPGRLARFHKTHGEKTQMKVGDEFVVRMPAPWDGPIRVVEKGGEHFRFATMDGHLEAGQIEWRAWRDQHLHFAVESWSRSGDRFSAYMHDGLKVAKEMQLYMWTSVLERVGREVGGSLVEGVYVTTRRVAPEAFADS